MKMRTFLWVLAALFGIISAGLADDGTWEPVNAAYFMKQVKSIDVGYTDGQDKYVYAAEAAGGGKLRYSTNDGASWTNAGLIVQGNHGVIRVAVEKDNFNIAWALVSGNDRYDEFAGPHQYDRSTGLWTRKVDQNLADHMLLYSMAVDYSDPGLNTVLVGGDGERQGVAYLFMTTNGGDEWDQVSIPINPSSNGFDMVTDIRFAPSDQQTVYLIVENDGGWWENEGLYRSTDGGLNWEHRSNYPAPKALAVKPTDSNVLVMSILDRGTVLISSDGGANWDGLFGPPCDACYCSAIEYSSDDYVYMTFTPGYYPVGGQGLFVVRANMVNQPPTIEYMPAEGEWPGDYEPLSVALDPRNTNNVYIGTEWMFYGSSDRCLNLQPQVNGANILSTILCVEADLPILYFMANQPPFGSIYRSMNYGLNWSVRKADGITTSSFIHSDQGQNGLVFAGSNFESGTFKIYRSFDYGDSWSLWPGGLWEGSLNCLTVDPTNDWIYWGISGHNQGVWQSSDNGDSWISYFYATVPDPRDIAIHPVNRATFVIADVVNGLYRTFNRQDFSEINGGLPATSANRIAYCPGQPSLAVATTPYGVYESDDMDQENPTWREANDGGYAGDIEDIIFHPLDNSIVCISVDGTIGTFFISADTARSWIELREGLDGHIPGDLTIDDVFSDTFYVATTGGIYKLKNPVKSGTLPLTPSTQTWGPGLIIVNGDVTVPAGVTLNIAPGTTIKFLYDFDRLEGGWNPNRSELLVQGTLYAHGNLNSPIVFESSSPANGKWYGIWADINGSIDMDYCIVRDAEEIESSSGILLATGQ